MLLCGHLVLCFKLTRAMIGRVSIVAKMDEEPVRVKPSSVDHCMRVPVTKKKSQHQQNKLSLEIFERARGLASTTMEARNLLLGLSHSLQETLRVFEERLEIRACYEPCGVAPRRGHVVRLEPFANIGVLSRGDMLVEDDRVTSMPLLAWTERVEVEVGVFESWRCSARVHRNQIYVVDNEDTWTRRLIITPISGIALKALETAKPAAERVASVASFSSLRALGAMAHSAFFASYQDHNGTKNRTLADSR